MDKKILTLHPDPSKAGVNISKEKYELIRDAILMTLKSHEDILFKDLPGEVEEALQGVFDRSIPWYVTTVKLDLKARKLIERIPGGTPQRLRLIDK